MELLANGGASVVSYCPTKVLSLSVDIPHDTQGNAIKHSIPGLLSFMSTSCLQPTSCLCIKSLPILVSNNILKVSGDQIDN